MKNFNSLIKKMDSLKETEKGKLKGGISVVVGASLSVEGTNGGICVNNGDCSQEKNTGTCHNYPKKLSK